MLIFVVKLRPLRVWIMQDDKAHMTIYVDQDLPKITALKLPSKQVSK